MNPTMTQVELAKLMLDLNERCPRCYLSRTRSDGTEFRLELGYSRYASGDQAIYHEKDGVAIVSVYSAAHVFLSND